jgi:hypothetical protein
VQFACHEKLGVRKAFNEQIADVPAGARVTGRLRRHVARAVGDGAPVSTACDGLMSWPIRTAPGSGTPPSGERAQWRIVWSGTGTIPHHMQQGDCPGFG